MNDPRLQVLFKGIEDYSKMLRAEHEALRATAERIVHLERVVQKRVEEIDQLLRGDR